MNNVPKEILKKLQGKFFESDNALVRIIKVWSVVGKTIYTYSDVKYKMSGFDVQYNRSWVLSDAYMANHNYKRITKSEFETAVRKGNYKKYNKNEYR